MPPLVRYSAAWGFVRACAYYLSMIVSGALLTVGMLLTWPIVHLYDPTLFTYQLWTMALARLCLQPLTTIRVKVRAALSRAPNISHELNARLRTQPFACLTRAHNPPAPTPFCAGGREPTQGPVCDRLQPPVFY